MALNVCFATKHGHSGLVVELSPTCFKHGRDVIALNTRRVPYTSAQVRSKYQTNFYNWFRFWERNFFGLVLNERMSVSKDHPIQQIIYTDFILLRECVIENKFKKN